MRPNQLLKLFFDDDESQALQALPEVDLSSEEDVGVLRAKIQALETTLGQRGKQLEKLRNDKTESDVEVSRLECEVGSLEMELAEVKKKLQAALNEARELNRQNKYLQKQYAHAVSQFLLSNALFSVSYFCLSIYFLQKSKADEYKRLMDRQRLVFDASLSDAQLEAVLTDLVSVEKTPAPELFKGMLEARNAALTVANNRHKRAAAASETAKAENERLLEQVRKLKEELRRKQAAAAVPAADAPPKLHAVLAAAAGGVLPTSTRPATAAPHARFPSAPAGGFDADFDDIMNEVGVATGQQAAGPAVLAAEEAVPPEGRKTTARDKFARLQAMRVAREAAQAAAPVPAAPLAEGRYSGAPDAASDDDDDLEIVSDGDDEVEEGSDAPENVPPQNPPAARQLRSLSGVQLLGAGPSRAGLAAAPGPSFIKKPLLATTGLRDDADYIKRVPDGKGGLTTLYRPGGHGFGAGAGFSNSWRPGGVAAVNAYAGAPRTRPAGAATQAPPAKRARGKAKAPEPVLRISHFYDKVK